MAKEKNNFASQIHLACAVDPLRPAMECVHFVNGFAYASDANIVIKQSLEYSNVENMDLLEGKSLHRDSYKEVLTYKTVTATEEGLKCVDDNEREAFFYFTDVDIPNFEAVLNLHSRKPVDFIGLSPKLLTVIGKALIGADKEGIKIHFNGIDKGMLIEVLLYENQVALLMPRILEPSLF